MDYTLCLRPLHYASDHSDTQINVINMLISGESNFNDKKTLSFARSSESRHPKHSDGSTDQPKILEYERFHRCFSQEKNKTPTCKEQ